MKCEILFKEVCNLYGDYGNVMLLKKCFPKEIIETSFNEVPYFVNHKVDFLYLGPMSESMQEKVIQKLLPYKERIKELIEENTVFLFTGNAIEILGSEIKEETKTIKGLNLFQITTKRHPENRYNSLVLATYKDSEIVGYISSSSTPTIKEPSLFQVVKEKNNLKEEGIHYKNFFGTTLLGPILVLNPKFTKNLLSLLGYHKKLPFERELYFAYEKRLSEYKKEIEY